MAVEFFASNAVVQPALSSPVVSDLVFSNAARLRLAGRYSMKAVSVGDNAHNAERHATKIIASSSNYTCISFPFDAGATRSGSCLQQTRHRSIYWYVCRVNSFEQAGSPDREDTEESREDDSSDDGAMRRRLDITSDAGKQGNRADGDGTNARTQSSIVNLSFRSSSPKADGFLPSSSPPFDEEFYATIMSLDASHYSGPRASNSRACQTSKAALFDAAGVGSSVNAGCDVPQPSPDHGDDARGGFTAYTSFTQGKDMQPLHAVAMSGVQLPSSIMKLRRKGDNRVSAVKDRRCAIRKAFASMVFMVEAVQSHALQMRQAISSEWDVHEVLLHVHREMHSTFVWLFQTVFACTPQLMVSIMILLANFTVFSMRENVAMTSVTVTPASLAFVHSKYGSQQWLSDPNLDFGTQIYSTLVVKNFLWIYPQPGSEILGGGSGGKNNFPSGTTAESSDRDACRKGALTQRHLFADDLIRDSHYPGLTADAVEKRIHSDLEQPPRPTHQDLLNAWAESSMQDLELRSGELLQHVQLEQGAIQRLVSPVAAQLESDNYSCFDRTDLVYQHALSEDPFNALLLANYAQFLYVVRHDNDRAEEYFHRAVQADPLDSTILGRFANFVWLVRGFRSTSEKAYKAAMKADLDSSIPASNYAHFLWHSGEGDASGLMSA